MYDTHTSLYTQWAFRFLLEGVLGLELGLDLGWIWVWIWGWIEEE